MSCPEFSNITEDSDQLLDKHFDVGIYKIGLGGKLNEQSSNSVKLNSKCRNNLNASVNHKHQINDKACVSADICSDTGFNVETEITNVLVEGLSNKFRADLNLLGQSAQICLKNAFIKPNYSIVLNTNSNLEGNLAALYRHKNYFFGAEAKLSSSLREKKSESLTAAIGYEVPDTYLFRGTISTDLNYTANVFQKINDANCLAAKISWSARNSNFNYTIAAQHNFNESNFVKAKYDNKSSFQLAYGLRLKPGMALGFSTGCGDAFKRIGISLDFNL